MCSISGFFTNGFVDETFLTDMIYNSSERGVDSNGFAYVSRDGTITSQKVLHRFEKEQLQNLHFDGIRCMIHNHRAEPTTEHIKNKCAEDCHPFCSENFLVVHNGIISNDNDLRKELGITTESAIDTAVVPHVLELDGAVTYETIQKLKGSCAMAILKRGENAVYLYRDYKPLVICYDILDETYFFTSLKKYFPCNEYNVTRYNIFEVPPYSLCRIDRDGFSILHQEKGHVNNKALIICSGGLDSTTAAAHAKYIDKKDITLLHFLYGCRAEDAEIKSVKKIAEVLQCDYKFVDVNWLKEIGGSSLTDLTKDVMEGPAGAEFPHEWVPARNTIFISLTAALSEVMDTSSIYMGLNLEEGGAYPDNTVEFYELFNKVLQFGTLNRPTIINPLGAMMKWQIVKYALEIGAPIQHSWSCYHGLNTNDGKPCGVCGPCFMRRSAFRMNDKEDMLDYAVKQ